MKILFIYSTVGSFDTFNYGVGSLSAVLKQEGHETNLLKLTSYNSTSAIQKIRLYSPDLIAISCTSHHWELAKKISEAIKKQLGLPIFVGGPHTTIVPDCLNETTFIDGICIGEGEHAFLELVNKIEKGEEFKNVNNFWFRDKNDIVKNEIGLLIENLDELPFPDRSIFPRDDILRYANFTFSRGCPYDCSYCCNSTLKKIYHGKGRFIRFRSVENAIDEIAHVVENYGPKELYFDDDSFIKGSTWFEKFCTEYSNLFDIPFCCNARPESINERTARLLKRAGCKMVWMGIETGDETLRREVLNRRLSNEQIIKAFRIAKKYGINTSSFNMVGIPGETYSKFLETIKLNQTIAPDRFQISIFYPYRGSKLGELCEKEGYINPEKIKSVHNFLYDTVLVLPDFPSKEIARSARWFGYLVYRKRSLRLALYRLLSTFIISGVMLSNSRALEYLLQTVIYLKNILIDRINTIKNINKILGLHKSQ